MKIYDLVHSLATTMNQFAMVNRAPDFGDSQSSLVKPHRLELPETFFQRNE